MSESSTDVVPPFALDWPTCRFDDMACAGRQIGGFQYCLAHLPENDLDTFLGTVSLGVNLDLRGTTLAAELLQRLLSRAALDPAVEGSPIRLGQADFRFCNFLGAAEFASVWFEGAARFEGAQFKGEAQFEGARFQGPVWFERTQFKRPTSFEGAQFMELANFEGAQFKDVVDFERTQFEQAAWFQGARFAGRAWFVGAQFKDTADYSGAEFAGRTIFHGAQFTEQACFQGVQFEDMADFEDAQFAASAWFQGVQVKGVADFEGARFKGRASFKDAHFENVVDLQRAQFEEEVTFNGVRFKQRVRFAGARFVMADRIGPLVADLIEMTRVSFAKRVVIEVETGALLIADARFEQGVELRARYARVSFRRVFFGGPSSLSGAPESFVHVDGVQVVTDQKLIARWAVGASTIAKLAAGHGGAGIELWVPHLVSVQETDVSQLTLADVDLRWCHFAGAHQLDKLRLEGRSPFNRPPRGWWAGWAWLPVWRWSPRRVLAEEHPWRASRRKSGGWNTDAPHLDYAIAAPEVSPERLAVLYRSLRKAFEDAKNEAGAGDFYYGEMEARRHASTTGRGERALLSLYWMISGYGQRAGRTLAALVLLVGVLFGLLTQFGLPASAAVQQMTATVPPASVGQDQKITVDVKPVTPALPPQGQRWTADRMDKAIGIAVGSVVFRDSGVPLTRAGTWTVMAGRALGPLLLALAALAIRARVKR